MWRRSLRSDGAGFYQLGACEYSFSMIKIALIAVFWGRICRIAMKTIFFMFYQGNRWLTLTAVQGILLRFSLF
ncbi:DUF2575 family protein [Salmonella bongori]|uniref:DUF2575 family protein n=1 Tax=Salmonella bongori TaxID=54736 RepID=UPI0009A9B7EA|nr:DUF2575 family protein [Salmonella bongori]EDP8626506.1 DUF2575 domain-containing protein [Salmonella bongori]EDP8656670.1 DUF2575 domain-containing protein [Salmonella bongori]EEU7164707.1 DUF2575 domain-containing protein [Salmonella bongori]EIU0392683.1 DUF2575 family protein [Salmonella bongori]MBA3225536.1 DUF2575 family protein [Salmonella bongori]